MVTKTTTIRIQYKTKDRLVAIGRKNQSFDSIVSSLLTPLSSQNTASNNNNSERQFIEK